MTSARARNLPMVDMGGGYKFEAATIIPAGGQVAAYVLSGGVQSGMDREIARRLHTTLNSALNECSDQGDYVLVLPGHEENISSADQMSNLVAGTTILGLGSGTNRPTFTWTTAASSFLLDVADVTIANCVLKLCDASNGGVTVAAPITVSAAGCAIVGCDIRFGADADDIVTIGITTTAAADDFSFIGNKCTGATAAECTTFLRLVGADRFYMADCYVDGATSSTTVGVLQMLTTASTNVFIDNCQFVNRKALSVHAATGMAGATGVVKGCFFGILDNATTAGFETEGNLFFSECTVANAVGEAGVAKTPVSV